MQEYRKKLLMSKQISDDIKQFSYEICQKHKVIIRYMETDKEHTFWTDGYFVCSVGNVSEEMPRKYIENHQILQTLQSSLFYRPALRNNNQCHRSGVSAAASHADQNPFCRSTGKNHFCAYSYYNRSFGGIYHTDCVQVLCDICRAHDGSEDGARHEKGAFRPI